MDVFNQTESSGVGQMAPETYFYSMHGISTPENKKRGVCPS
jgi:hypothetical protein